MATPRTECSELSVAFGLLGVENPLDLDQDQVDRYFEDTLSAEKYARFKVELPKREAMYRRMYNVGFGLRATYPPFKNVRNIQWSGPQQQAATTAAAKDLLVANTPFSVKAESNVVQNPSPYNLFESIPRGQVRAQSSENWYLERDPQGFQGLYSFIREFGLKDLPPDVGGFERVASKESRRRVQDAIKRLSGNDKKSFYQSYLSMCHTVAQASATIFNENFSVSMQGKARSAVLEHIAKFFFRMNTVDYILGGIDWTDEFAVLVPELTKWKRDWAINYVEALPDLTRRQSVVNLLVSYQKKGSGSSHTAQFHAEIRWSHGKFCGNPEAKLYKDFAWNQVVFSEPLYGREPITKLGIIGEGSFGIVYEAMDRQRGEKVAVKVFQSTIATTKEERARFEREVKIMSRLNHPNILPILDYDLSPRSSPWFTMPLAQGNIADILDELQGDYRRINYIFRQVLEGMAYAHRSGVIHRDLKPQNILLFTDNKAMVGDFGLGKRLGEIGSTVALTASDEFMGTFSYAAPEQFEAMDEVDYRADIYALGKTLLHMVTGSQPMFAERILHRSDKRYHSFIERCIKEAPKDRFQSVDEIAEMFETVTSKFS